MIFLMVHPSNHEDKKKSIRRTTRICTRNWLVRGLAVTTGTGTGTTTSVCSVLIGLLLLLLMVSTIQSSFIVVLAFQSSNQIPLSIENTCRCQHIHRRLRVSFTLQKRHVFGKHNTDTDIRIRQPSLTTLATTRTKTSTIGYIVNKFKNVFRFRRKTINKTSYPSIVDSTSILRDSMKQMETLDGTFPTLQSQQQPLPKQQQPQQQPQPQPQPQHRLEISDEDKKRFLNASLQNHNVLIPSLLTIKSPLRDGQQIDTYINDPQDVTARPILNTNDQDSQRDTNVHIVDYQSNHNTAKRKPLSTITQTNDRHQSHRDLDQHPTRVESQDMNRAWVDRILNSNRVQQSVGQDGVTTATTRTTTTTTTKSSETLLNQTSSPVRDIGIHQPLNHKSYTNVDPPYPTNLQSFSLNPNSSFMDAFWNHRKAIDIIQQRLVNISSTPVNEIQSPVASRGRFSTTIGKNKSTLSSSTNLGNSDVIESNIEPSDVPQWNSNDTNITTNKQYVVPNSLNHTRTIVSETLLNAKKQSKSQYSEISVNKIPDMKQQLHERQQSQKEQPLLATTTKKKIIRMELPLIDHSIDNDNDSDNVEENSSSTIMTTSAPEIMPSSKTTTTTPSSSSSLDRSKKWGIDMSRFT